jgi:PAS domain S-box-containing protein
MEDIFRPDKIRDTLERLISNLPGFVYRCRNDVNWTMIFASDQCEEITGYKPEELIDNSVVSFDDVIEEPFREIVRRKWHKALLDHDVFKEEYRIVRKDGVCRWVLEQGRGVFSPVTGKLLYLDGYITDITDRVEAYDNILKANRLKSVFLSNLSHELRTPVNAIQGFTDILKHKDLSVHKREEFLEIINSSNSSLLRLIDDIILASKIETGEFLPEISRTTVGELVQQLFSLVNGYAISEDSVKIQFVDMIDESDRDLMMETDLFLVKEIIRRLFDNSLRHTPKGSISLKLSLSDGLRQLNVMLSDTGPGIEAIYSEDIFKSFFRLDNTINTLTRGAGLGLFIARAAARALNGELTYMKERYPGAHFTLSIPVS